MFSTLSSISQLFYKIKYMKLSDIAVRKIKGNNQLIGRLMVEFDRGQKAIETWLKDHDQRLTLPEAVRIISEETRLTTEEILDNTDQVAA